MEFFFDQSVKSKKIYKDIIDISNGNYVVTGNLWDFQNFKKHYKLIDIDLSQQQDFDSDPKIIPQASVMGTHDNNTDNNAFLFLKYIDIGFLQVIASE